MAEAATLKFIENAFDLFENRWTKKYWLQYQQIENLTRVVTDLKRYIDWGFRKAKLPQGLWHEKEGAVKLDIETLKN